MQKKNILFIHHGVGIGGAPISLINLIKSLNHDKYEVKIACLKDGDHIKLFQAEGIKTEVINSSTKYFIHAETSKIQWYYFPYYLVVLFVWSYTAFYLAPKYLAKQDADLIHLNSHVLSSWAYAAKKKGYKVVLHNREAVAKGYFGLRKFVLQYLIKNYTDHIINISKDNSERLGIKSKSSVVYNSVEIPETYRTPFDNNTTKVLYLGGTAKIKGYENVVKSIVYLDPNIELLFCGSIQNNSEKTLFQKLIYFIKKHPKKNDLSILRNAKNVDVIGLVKNVNQYLDKCDILITPFKKPHFSRPVIEAFAYGKPVIGTDVVGMDEIIDHEVNGIIVRNNSPKELAEAINKLSRERKFAIKLGLAGRAKAIKYFSPEVSAAKVEYIYKNLIEN